MEVATNDICSHRDPVDEDGTMHAMQRRAAFAVVFAVTLFLYRTFHDPSILSILRVMQISKCYSRTLNSYDWLTILQTNYFTQTPGYPDNPSLGNHQTLVSILSELITDAYSSLHAPDMYHVCINEPACWWPSL